MGVESDLPTYDLMPGADPIDDNEDLGNVEGFYDDDELLVDSGAADAGDDADDVADDATDSGDADSAAGAMDDAADEEEVADDVEEAAPAPEPAHKPILIPKERMDTEIAKRRKAEQRVQELEQQMREQARPKIDPEAVEAEVTGLLTRANEALLNGDTAEASKLQREAVLKQQSLLAPQNDAQPIDTASIREQVKEELRIETILADATAKFPALDQDNEQFDSELYEQALALEELYFNRGFTASQSLERAISDAIKLRRPDLLEAPAPAPTPKAKPSVRKEVTRKVAAANQQPPVPQGVSADTFTEAAIDPLKLSDEDFDALPEATRARLRGDYM